MNKGREFQPQPGAIGNPRRGMVMPDDASAVRLLGLAVAVLKDEIGRLPTRRKLDCACHMAIVIPGERDQFTALAEPREQPLSGIRRSPIVDQITRDN